MTNQPPGVVDKTAKTVTTKKSYDESFDKRFSKELDYISKSHRLVYRYCSTTKQVYHRDYYTYDKAKKSLVSINVNKKLSKECAQYFEKIKKANNPSYADFTHACEQFIEGIDIILKNRELEMKAAQLCLNPINHLTLFSTPEVNDEFHSWNSDDNEDTVEVDNSQGEYFKIVHGAVKLYTSERSSKLTNTVD